VVVYVRDLGVLDALVRDRVCVTMDVLGMVVLMDVVVRAVFELPAGFSVTSMDVRHVIVVVRVSEGIVVMLLRQRLRSGGRLGGSLPGPSAGPFVVRKASRSTIERTGQGWESESCLFL